jgi:hypothetical protein
MVGDEKSVIERGASLVEVQQSITLALHFSRATRLHGGKRQAQYFAKVCLGKPISSKLLLYARTECDNRQTSKTSWKMDSISDSTEGFAAYADAYTGTISSCTTIAYLSG